MKICCILGINNLVVLICLNKEKGRFIFLFIKVYVYKKWDNTLINKEENIDVSV